MEESGQRASRKFVVFIHRSVRSRREKREEEKKRVITHSDQGIAQVRPDKSSATGDENTRLAPVLGFVLMMVFPFSSIVFLSTTRIISL